MRAHGQFNGGSISRGLLEARVQLPIVQMGQLKQRPKGTQRVGGGTGGNWAQKGIQRLTWEVVKERQPGCKARRIQKKRSWEPRLRRRSEPKIQRPARRWWTPRPRDTPGLLKDTQRSGAGSGTRDAGNPRRRSQPSPSLSPGRTLRPHSHCPVPEAFKHGQRSVVAALAQQCVDSQE